MDSRLKSTLEGIGWSSLYERYIPDMGPPNQKGERRCRSPFPDTNNTNASFAVNIENGLWYCFVTGRGGDFISFVSLLYADKFDEKGLGVKDYGKTERDLLKEFGLADVIPPEYVVDCVNELQSNVVVKHQISLVKPWNPTVLKQLGIGFDVDTNRITIPLYERNGQLANVKLYQPGGKPKMYWKASGLGSNFLFPYIGWIMGNEHSLILCEGETDVISLRSLGFPAVSGTVGSGAPVPEGDWWRNKDIWILMDDDPSGAEAEIEAVRVMRALARNIKVLRLPSWEGKSKNADISEYILYLISLGYTVEQQQREVSKLFDSAMSMELPHQSYDKPPESQDYTLALTGANIGKRVRFIARVTAKSSNRYMLPIMYEVSCPGGGHSYCKNCPMHTQYHGNARFIHDPRSETSLKLIQTTDEKQIAVIKDEHGIVKKCMEPRINVQVAVDIDIVMLNSSVRDNEFNEKTFEYNRREAFIICLDNNNQIKENQDYAMEGFVYSHPKLQESVFLIDRYEPYIVSHLQFKQTEDTIQRLSMFKNHRGESVEEKLLDVAKDISDSCTLIRGRDDLHLLYRTVFHSPLHFDFCGRMINRGWIECIVIGDTRCGKSETFKQMCSLYNNGVLVDCKLQTTAGILGTVVQSQSGEYYVVAGLLPQQDGNIICFDEFTHQYGKTSIMESLSSTRSDGIVKISKAAHAEFKARVRSIWLANPGAGKLISELPYSGIEVLNRVISQPEDIARFDIAMTVSQSDVSPEIINTTFNPSLPKYSKEASRLLLSWTWSRSVSDIVIDDQAAVEIVSLAMRMHKKYDASIPIVEIADQRIRIAKIAISIAAQCFSCDSTGEKIVVRSEHVKAAEWLFTLCYDKPVMGYDIYSEKFKKNNCIENELEIRRVFDEVVKPNGFRFAEELLELNSFSSSLINSIVPSSGIFANEIIQIFYKNRAVTVVNKYGKEIFEKTPAFTAFLKQYMAENKKENLNK